MADDDWQADDNGNSARDGGWNDDNTRDDYRDDNPTITDEASVVGSQSSAASTIGSWSSGIDSFLEMIPELVISGVVIVVVISIMKFMNGSGGGAFNNVFTSLSNLLDFLLKHATLILWVFIACTISGAVTVFLSGLCTSVAKIRGTGQDKTLTAITDAIQAHTEKLKNPVKIEVGDRPSENINNPAQENRVQHALDEIADPDRTNFGPDIQRFLRGLPILGNFFNSSPNDTPNGDPGNNVCTTGGCNTKTLTTGLQTIKSGVGDDEDFRDVTSYYGPFMDFLPDIPFNGTVCSTPYPIAYSVLRFNVDDSAGNKILIAYDKNHYLGMQCNPHAPLIVRRRQMAELVMRANFIKSQHRFPIITMKNGNVVAKPLSYMRGGYLIRPPPKGWRKGGRTHEPGFQLARMYDSLAAAWYKAGICDKLPPYTISTAVDEVTCRLPPQGVGDCEMHMDMIASLLTYRMEWPQTTRSGQTVESGAPNEWRRLNDLYLNPPPESPALQARRHRASQLAIPTMPGYTYLNNVLGMADGMHAISLDTCFVATSFSDSSDLLKKLSWTLFQNSSTYRCRSVRFPACRKQLFDTKNNQTLQVLLPATSDTNTANTAKALPKNGHDFLLVAVTCSIVQLPCYAFAFPWGTSVTPQNSTTNTELKWETFHACMKQVQDEWILLSIIHAHQLGEATSAPAREAAKDFIKSCTSNETFDYAGKSPVRKGAYRCYSTEPFMYAAYYAGLARFRAITGKMPSKENLSKLGHMSDWEQFQCSRHGPIWTTPFPYDARKKDVLGKHEQSSWGNVAVVINDYCQIVDDPCTWTRKRFHVLMNTDVDRTKPGVSMFIATNIHDLKTSYSDWLQYTQAGSTPAPFVVYSGRDLPRAGQAQKVAYTKTDYQTPISTQQYVNGGLRPNVSTMKYDFSLQLLYLPAIRAHPKLMKGADMPQYNHLFNCVEMRDPGSTQMQLANQDYKWMPMHNRAQAERLTHWEHKILLELPTGKSSDKQQVINKIFLPLFDPQFFDNEYDTQIHNYLQSFTTKLDPMATPLEFLIGLGVFNGLLNPNTSRSKPSESWLSTNVLPQRGGLLDGDVIDYSFMCNSSYSGGYEPGTPIWSGDKSGAKWCQPQSVDPSKRNNFPVTKLRPILKTDLNTDTRTSKLFLATGQTTPLTLQSLGVVRHHNSDKLSTQPTCPWAMTDHLKSLAKSINQNIGSKYLECITVGPDYKLSKGRTALSKKFYTDHQVTPEVVGAEAMRSYMATVHPLDVSFYSEGSTTLPSISLYAQYFNAQGYVCAYARPTTAGMPSQPLTLDTQSGGCNKTAEAQAQNDEDALKSDPNPSALLTELRRTGFPGEMIVYEAAAPTADPEQDGKAGDHSVPGWQGESRLPPTSDRIDDQQNAFEGINSSGANGDAAKAGFARRQEEQRRGLAIELANEGPDNSDPFKNPIQSDLQIGRADQAATRAAEANTGPCSRDGFGTPSGGSNNPRGYIATENHTSAEMTLQRVATSMSIADPDSSRNLNIEGCAGSHAPLISFLSAFVEDDGSPDPKAFGLMSVLADGAMNPKDELKAVMHSKSEGIGANFYGADGEPCVEGSPSGAYYPGATPSTVGQGQASYRPEYSIQVTGPPEKREVEELFPKKTPGGEQPDLLVGIDWDGSDRLSRAAFSSHHMPKNDENAKAAGYPMFTHSGNPRYPDSYVLNNTTENVNFKESVFNSSHSDFLKTLVDGFNSDQKRSSKSSTTKYILKPTPGINPLGASDRIATYNGTGAAPVTAADAKMEFLSLDPQRRPARLTVDIQYNCVNRSSNPTSNIDSGWYGCFNQQTGEYYRGHKNPLSTSKGAVHTGFRDSKFASNQEYSLAQRVTTDGKPASALRLKVNPKWIAASQTAASATNRDAEVINAFKSIGQIVTRDGIDSEPYDEKKMEEFRALES